MNKWIVLVNILRYLALSLSLIGFACHFAQCALLIEYQHRTNIPGWFSAGHWQYLAWYVAFGLSALSAIAVCTHATCCRRSHILRGDKCLGLVNIVPLTATLLSNTFLGGQEPWTNGIVEFKVPAKGFITFCNMLNEDTDASYPILFQRCLLLDGTYVLAVMLCLTWIILVLCTCFIKVRKTTSLARLPNENGCTSSDKSRPKIIDNTFSHPYTRKHSTSFEESFQYGTPANSAYQKYAVPIAPHMEKVELPASYDNTGAHGLEHQPLTRRHDPSSVSGGWVEYTTQPDTSLYHPNQNHGQEENPWYPNINKNRVI